MYIVTTCKMDFYKRQGSVHFTVSLMETKRKTYNLFRHRHSDIHT